MIALAKKPVNFCLFNSTMEVTTEVRAWMKILNCAYHGGSNE